jgi:pectate lyase
MIERSRPWWLFTIAAVLTLAGCKDDTGDRPGSTPVATAPTPAPVPTTTIGSLGATGWASTAAGTTGGNGATAAKTYTVSNRNDLIQALYGNTATIADDGGVTGTLDTAPKIIYVNGTINLNVDRLLREYTADEYIRSSCASAQFGFFSEAQLDTAYQAAYRPSVWGNATVPTGAPESARVCAATLQRRVVQVAIPSNTSIIGIGGTARIINGNLNIGPSAAAPVENIVIRNIGFEDAFDFFPQWDPTDSTTGRWNSAYDLISVQYARRIWIDHNSFSDGARTDDRFPSVWNETVNGVDYRGSDFKVQHHDGAVDVTRNGDLVSVSNNYIANHDKTFLIGGTDTASLTAENPTALRVTFNDNYFLNLRQRLPRVRYGQVHVFNNVYVGSTTDRAYPFLIGFTVGQSGKIYAENNVFQVTGATVTLLANASVSAARTTSCRSLGYSEEQCQSTFYAAGTLLNGNAVDVQASLLSRSSAVTPTRWNPASAYSYVLKPTAGLAQTVFANSGAGKL